MGLRLSRWWVFHGADAAAATVTSDGDHADADDSSDGDRNGDYGHTASDGGDGDVRRASLALADSVLDADGDGGDALAAQLDTSIGALDDAPAPVAAAARGGAGVSLSARDHAAALVRMYRVYRALSTARSLLSWTAFGASAVLGATRVLRIAPVRALVPALAARLPFGGGVLSAVAGASAAAAGSARLLGALDRAWWFALGVFVGVAAYTQLRWALHDRARGVDAKHLLQHLAHSVRLAFSGGGAPADGTAANHHHVPYTPIMVLSAPLAGGADDDDDDDEDDDAQRHHRRHGHSRPRKRRRRTSHTRSLSMGDVLRDDDDGDEDDDDDDDE